MNCKKIIALSTIFSLFAFAVVSYGANLQRATTTLTYKTYEATITKVYGRVELQTIGEVYWKKVDVGMKLKTNDRIRTFEKAMIVVAFEDNAVATMGENSIIDVLELKKGTNTENLKFNLWIGKLRAKVKEFKNLESDFKVITPTAVLGIRGTKWGTLVDEDGRTSVVVEEGQVWIQNLSGTQRYLIQENQKVTVTSDGVVSTPEKLTPEEKDKYLQNWKEPSPIEEEKKLQETQPQQEKPKELKKELPLSCVVGSRMIDKENYNELIFQPEFIRGKFGIGLNLLARWNEDGFRKEDWDEIGNIINYVRWAHKGDKPLYIHLGKLNATLGHGFIVDRYSNQGTDTSKVIFGSILDINLKYGGLETLVNDATEPRIYGGRIYFKPLKNMKMPLVNKIIIGTTYVNDTEPQPRNKNDLTVYGLDLELPIYGKRLALYADYAKIKDFGDGRAFGAGGELNFTPGYTTFGYKAELRELDPNFVPALFNPLYEIARRGTETIQNAKSQKGWYVGCDLDIAKLILLSLGYEDIKEDEAPRIYLEGKVEEPLFQLITKRNISISWTYNHKKIGKDVHLIDFNAPNTTIIGKVNFEIAENISLSYIHQKVYDKEGNKSETSSLSTQMRL